MAKTLDIGLLDAQRVAHPFAVAAAANKAVYYESTHPKLRAASLHAEMILSLWAGRNLTEALRSLGASDESSEVLVAIIDATPAFVKHVVAQFVCAPAPSTHSTVASHGVGVGATMAGEHESHALGDASSHIIYGSYHGMMPLDEYYPARCDTEWLRKNYKISEEELTVSSLCDAVVGRIAIQEFTTGGGGAASSGKL